MLHPLSSLLLSRLSEFVAAQLGLDFPPERWPDLERGIRAAAPELGFENVGACIRHLVSAPVSRKSVQILSVHLTIGETYFFREQNTLAIFTDQILPELIAARRGRAQHLRLWSAGCCTGEEAYSLAILVCQSLPDADDWNITIFGTDINPRFLEKAAAGVYSEWSFRLTSPATREKYFQETPDGLWEVTPRIKKMAAFSALNLMEESYPAPLNGTAAMDVIFCRNVLIYFAPAPAKKIVGNFLRALGEGGWLIVGSTETSESLFSQFATVNFSGATLYRKEKPGGAGLAPALLSVPALPPPTPPSSTGKGAGGLGSAGAGGNLETPAALLQLARACADEGRLAEARDWCEKAIARDKLDPISHYLRATILQEEGAAAEAIQSLKRALYLNPDFVPAHFALGNLLRQQGNAGESDRHLGNALRLLKNYRPEDILPESEGMTAGRLSDIISDIIAALREGRNAP